MRKKKVEENKRDNRRGRMEEVEGMKEGMKTGVRQHE